MNFFKSLFKAIAMDNLFSNPLDNVDFSYTEKTIVNIDENDFEEQFHC
jgi:hypothetical protein